MGTIKLGKPVDVSIRASVSGAVIRYTLNGTEPDERSAQYSGPIRITNDARLRARSFAPGYEDLWGDMTIFIRQSKGVFDDFESTEMGVKAAVAKTVEEGKCTARVSDGKAASGSRSLKFIDGPGSKMVSSPHVYYKTLVEEGRIAVSFAMLVDADATIYAQCRDYAAGGKYAQGPTVRIEAGGKLVHDGKTLLEVPIGEWVTFEAACALGEDASGKFDLTVRLPGGEVKSFAGLPCDPSFITMEWFGFASISQGESIVYVDDIRITAEEKPEDQ